MKEGDRKFKVGWSRRSGMKKRKKKKKKKERGNKEGVGKIEE
ncbi:unnamed protein product [Cuscuta europaea]|uniref:Uncharacterized protein n=1 Tax=Cuscuta europaea TaxID=41803 RepID=A0A9P0ZRK9_CUSEU|nr:unnamed protein product [Cuscuta europaea]